MTGTQIIRGAYPETPELDKMKACKDQSQPIGAFLDWLQETKGVQFGKPHVHNESCPGWDKERDRYNPSGSEDRCSFFNHQFEPIPFEMEKILAEYFGVDLKKANKERDAVLNWVRRQN